MVDRPKPFLGGEHSYLAWPKVLAECMQKMGADPRMEGALISAHVGYARADAVERLILHCNFLVAPPAQDIFALDDPLSTGLSS